MYDFTLFWGDGAAATRITSATTLTHTYASPGSYRLVFSGKLERISFGESASMQAVLVSVANMGGQDMGYRSLDGMFEGCSHLKTVTMRSSNPGSFL